MISDAAQIRGRVYHLRWAAAGRLFGDTNKPLHPFFLDPPEIKVALEQPDRQRPVPVHGFCVRIEAKPGNLNRKIYNVIGQPMLDSRSHLRVLRPYPTVSEMVRQMCSMYSTSPLLRDPSTGAMQVMKASTRESSSPDMMHGFDEKVNLSSVSEQRRTLSVVNPSSQAILRICITFGHH